MDVSQDSAALDLGVQFGLLRKLSKIVIALGGRGSLSLCTLS